MTASTALRIPRANAIASAPAVERAIPFLEDRLGQHRRRSSFPSPATSDCFARGLFNELGPDVPLILEARSLRDGHAGLDLWNARPLSITASPRARASLSPRATFITLQQRLSCLGIEGEHLRRLSRLLIRDKSGWFSYDSDPQRQRRTSSLAEAINKGDGRDRQQVRKGLLDDGYSNRNPDILL